MRQEYQHVCIAVNKFIGLTENNNICSLQPMTEWTNETLGKRLRYARKTLRNMSQMTLSEKTGVSQQTISNIETDVQDTSTDIAILADVLDVRARWLYDGTGEIVDGLYIQDEKLKRMLMIAQELPEYAKDRAIKELADFAKYVEESAKEAKK